MPQQPVLSLKGFDFQALFQPSELLRLDQQFLAGLQQSDQDLHDNLVAYRTGEIDDPKLISQLIIDAGVYLDTFLAELFGIEEAAAQLSAVVLQDEPVFAFKKYYVLRCAKRELKEQHDKVNFSDLDKWVNEQLSINKLDSNDRELAIARLGQLYLQDAKAQQAQIDQLVSWCVAAMTSDDGQAAVKGWVSFKLPAKLDYQHLVALEPVPSDSLNRMQGPPGSFRERDGFALTDPRMSERQVGDETHYCVYCHKTDGDFCSKGFPVKKADRSLGFKVNSLDETLTGCPLEEKISEMHWQKKQGLNLAALATVMIDNPMCPATGHRICNDCMKACIYQKQEPVNIPQVETRVLTDILSLPWGVEIYDLLTRWNPLRQTQWVAKPYTGHKVLVMGMGPAGFTLAHHLLMEGCAVVGVDGLKMEPADEVYIQQPIYDYQQITESLDSRVMAGFGGVAEYGITVRWDKNFLKLIRISLLRRPYFQTFGSLRFGGTLTVEQAWQLGFDHLAIAVGAGLPRELNIDNSLAPGMRQANDFLMALQLTGAAKDSSLANLQVRLPAVVIGGGLTGVDTATEVQAYYIKQVEKVLFRYETLVNVKDEQSVRTAFNKNDLAVLDEFLEHGRLLRNERQQALREKRSPRFIELIRSWGGVTIAYRRCMQQSPAYKRNHEELTKALEEGIYYLECVQPTAVRMDETGYCSALVCEQVENGEQRVLPARAIFVATGAKPNVAYEFEHRGTFKRIRKKFEYVRNELQQQSLVEVEEKGNVKMPHFGAFTSYEDQQRYVTFLGDTHPVFHGSVVKAVASAMRVYPKVMQALALRPAQDVVDYASFRERMTERFVARVERVKRLAPHVVELTVKAPMAAASFHAGQFYRLQNYETEAAMVEGTRLQTEAMALIGFKRADQPEQLSLIVVERGASSRLVANFKPGERVALMGPTGAKTQIPEAETVAILGDELAVAHLLSVAPMLKEHGNKIIFISYLKNKDDIFLKEEIETLADHVIWLAPGQMLSTSLVDAQVTFDLQRITVVGHASLLREVQRIRQQDEKQVFAKTTFFASVYGSMQCMLKGVCAQCLQWQIDPETGKRTKAVYSCSWQNQPMEIVDIDNIDQRLGQNHMQEVLTNLWLTHLEPAYHLLEER